MAGPQFVKYFSAVISALKELGNSGTPSEVRNLIAQNLQLSDQILDEQLGSGGSRFDNQVAWARFYLAKAGYIDTSKRGVWRLTETGINLELNAKKSFEIFQEIQKGFKKESVEAAQISNKTEDSIAPLDRSLSDSSSLDYRQELLNLIKSLSPSGFEKLCQRLLRESGFQQVEVTGRTGDGGIDGKGILQINLLISIPVLFQCKRYNGSVGASQIRDFRGATMGRADKGIFITTGTFTVEARREAVRDGVPPIELVDGNKLIEMFENLELGLIPKTVYEIDSSFFEAFS
ncbi:restriction endonuclease [Desertifilum sp. FACHB-1129]|uniref:Restriction endonuclease n=1 Tax=Desertifilum tharense IPPAS B-1220 TaxID=1781255 RepID=A0A1E5QFP5_9CYAN|nr:MULTISPECIES: restriction endonuclease [Desertifilum]MDA0211594.1 restriction endonuclease [Cyanobacteria bacterium FC1]MBD2310118.1 restriction endonuclease [Desertifilum sp. FACHB-1129]MBD2322078.1 restriction endonuclease [Desertifilum sp. FACHB-866]MBD2333843.1 restriction endonuclease [Desertifilum sp. FACHB-868]OEJ73505.1 restriction endonuclease [Desertifilum tharense IPPAS B-1220]